MLSRGQLEEFAERGFLLLPQVVPCGTFTMLAGVLMSDQRGRDAGNLWVWPGTHLTHAE